MDGSANLVEIFSSVQGEGPELGTRTLFVRFGACDLRCRWCDSVHTWRPAAQARVEEAAGSGRFATWENPVALDAVATALEKLEPSAHRWLSLTGGEPLLQPEAVGALARSVRERGPGILLETHGLHAAALETLVDAVDLVSMDWKLASDVRRATDRGRGEPEPFHAAHAAFLEVARRAGARVVIKIVVTHRSRDTEIDEAVGHVARVHPQATLILQPVTPRGGGTQAPEARRLLALARRAEARLADVRVIPQTHPLLGVP